MIVFKLTCTHQHSFEGWFSSGNDYERQAAEGMIACPVCGDHGVSRLPSAPHVLKKPAQPAPRTAPEDEQLEHLLRGLRQLMDDSEDVGERFAIEARRIHYEEVPVRNIRGQASLSEMGDLLEEGIPVLPIPVPGKKDMH